MKPEDMVGKRVRFAIAGQTGEATVESLYKDNGPDRDNPKNRLYLARLSDGSLKTLTWRSMAPLEPLPKEYAEVVIRLVVDTDKADALIEDMLTVLEEQGRYRTLYKARVSSKPLTETENAEEAPQSKR
jgi:hypothetical protein